MSLFRQHAAPCAFPADESWVILSPIEASIKRKIEAVGTPLSEWDIHIYRGVLTGCNDAFIIPTARRNEILAACRDEAERERTAELIRPNNSHPIFAKHTIRSGFLFQLGYVLRVALCIEANAHRQRDIVLGTLAQPFRMPL